jgi:hypothetical protein
MPGEEGGLGVGVELQVVAQVLHRAGELEEVLDELGERLAALRHHLGEQERHEQAVALAHVRRDADAAGLLAADEHVALEHLLVDPLEADRRGGDLAGRGVPRRSTSTEVESVLTMRPVSPLSSARWRAIRQMMRCGLTKRRARRPRRCGRRRRRSRSRRRARRDTLSRSESMCGGIGSGCRPPKPGLRCSWIS